MSQISQQIEVLNQRIGEILVQTQPGAMRYPDLLSELLAESLEELNVAIEELQVSQDELYQQNQALVTATEDVSLERQRYQSLFEFAPDGYLVTTAEGMILEANRAIGAMLEMPQAYLVGKPLAAFIVLDERQGFRRDLAQLSRSEEMRQQEWLICLQPRRERPFEASVSVATTFDRSSKLVELRWLVRDITERRQLEEARLRMKLAEMVNQDLSTEITRRQRLEETLLQQADALRQANRMKDEFLAIVSHELRSPLNPILGWSELLNSRKLNEEDTHRALETIKRNAKLQAQLIDDLLDISRITQGKLRLENRPVPLANLLDTVIEAVQLAANAKEIDLQTQLDSREIIVAGDPMRLQQVFWNLLSNAIKFTPRQGQVEVRLAQSEQEAILTVRDTGCGISPEVLPHLFERFWQAERDTTRTHGGLGLGLAIAKNLAEMHGGTIEATSAGLEQGATFTVRLPLQLNSMPPDPISQPPADASLDHLRVLVVDDQADTRDMMLAVLEQVGAEVTAVESVDQALQALTHTSFQVLISDIGMPDKDGYLLIQQVRQLDNATKNIPAIALTAYATEADRRHALDAGFQAHLQKPIEPDELVKTIITQAINYPAR